MEDEVLLRDSARDDIVGLGVIGAGEGRRDKRLGVAALEERAAVDDRKDSHLAGDVPELVKAAAVLALLLFENQ